MLSQTWRIAKLTVLSLFVLLLALVGSGLVYRGYRHHEIANATAIDPVVGIDEEFFARIGGIDQWISIRRQSRSNPAVLLLHQGAGQAQSASRPALSTSARRSTETICRHSAPPSRSHSLYFRVRLII